MTCLTNIIGLTTKDYACWSANKPGTFPTDNVAKAGFYVDMDDYGPDLTDRSDVYDLLVNSRTQGETNFETQLRAAIARLTIQDMNQMKGTVGRFEKSVSRLSGLTNDIVGVNISSMSRYKGLKLKFKKIGLQIDTPGTYTINLVNKKDPTTVIATTNITTTTEKITFVPVTWDAIDFYEDPEIHKYALVYDRQGARPYSIQTKCGCNGDPRWYNEKWYGVNGVRVDALADLDADIVSSSFTNGLSFTFVLECDPVDFTCQVEPEFWTTTHIGRTIGVAIQYLSNINLIDRVLSENDPTNYTLINPDKLMADRKELNMIVEELMIWLAQKIVRDDVVRTYSHCMQCRPQMNLAMDEIIL